MENNNIWAVMPAYNEEKDIAGIIKNARKYVDEVVIVDDGSIDKTSKYAENAGAVVLRHIVNLGKGAALKTGCDFAIKKGAELIVVLDADAQHDPEDIPRFLDKLDKYGIVFSYRRLGGKMPLVLRFGNWCISGIVSLLYGISLNDTQCGFRAFTAEAYKKIRWNAIDYSMESEMIARAGKQKLKYVQISIETIYSDKYKGTTVVDGIKIVLNMFLWRLFNTK